MDPRGDFSFESESLIKNRVTKEKFHFESKTLQIYESFLCLSSFRELFLLVQFNYTQYPLCEIRYYNILRGLTTYT